MPTAQIPQTDWLALCRRVVEAQRELFADVRGIAARTQYDGIGEGGDHSLVIDRRSEDAVFDELQALAADGASFVAVSEERGEVSFGSGGGAHVVIDPIDGSLNARRTIPSFALSLAVASGPTMADVEFGYVYDFGAGEEFVARRGAGATLGGREVRVGDEREMLEVVGLESAEPEQSMAALETLKGRVYRLRVVGAIAISAAYVAAGRFEGMFGTRPCRSVDAAAAQLIVREAGGVVAFDDLPLDEAGLGLDERYGIAAAAGERGLALLRDAQRATATA